MIIVKIRSELITVSFLKYCFYHFKSGGFYSVRRGLIKVAYHCLAVSVGRESIFQVVEFAHPLLKLPILEPCLCALSARLRKQCSVLKTIDTR